MWLCSAVRQKSLCSVPERSSFPQSARRYAGGELMDLARTQLDAPFRFLDVRVVRSAHDRSQYVWQVRECDGTVLQYSTHTYSDDRQALRDGNDAARAIRKAG